MILASGPPAARMKPWVPSDDVLPIGDPAVKLTMVIGDRAGHARVPPRGSGGHL